MIGRTLKRLFARFGYRYGYDTSYMQNLVDSDRNGATKLALASLFTRYRFGLPAAHYFAAKIMATRYADCGSCLKLAIDMAAEAGVPLAHIRRLLLGPEEEAPPEMRLAARYARAVSENDPALSDIIEDCTRRWGETGTRRPGRGRHQRPVLSPVQTRAGTRQHLYTGAGVVAHG